MNSFMDTNLIAWMKWTQSLKDTMFTNTQDKRDDDGDEDCAADDNNRHICII